MCSPNHIIIGGVLIVAAGMVIYFINRSRKENFKVLGSMGPYTDLYYKCTSDCERSDPGKQLSPTHGNMMCQGYCDSIITDLARRGGPSYPMDLPTASTKNIKTRPAIAGLGSGGVVTSLDKSYQMCGDGEANAWCREKYFTGTEIDAKCRQDCEYSTYPTAKCMELCSASKKGNYSLGWSWK